jgi:hypothetical protein
MIDDKIVQLIFVKPSLNQGDLPALTKVKAEYLLTDH